MLDPIRLRVLVAVAKHGSVTAAAQALNYAQPSISHHIARLEAETGAKLMERAGRGIRLTDAGRLLAERAEEILGRLDAAEAELAMHVGLRQDRVRLAAFGSALSTLVAMAAATMRLEHFDTGLHLARAEPGQALRMLRAGETDIALIYRYLRDGAEPDALIDAAASQAAPDSEDRLLLDEPVYLISRAETATATGERVPAAESSAATAAAEPSAGGVACHRVPGARPPPGDPVAESEPGPAAGRGPPGPQRSLNDSDVRSAILAAHASERWIGAEEQCTEFLVDLCRSAGFGPDIAISSADFTAAQALTVAGLGVSILPGLALRASRHPGIDATELPGARRQVHAVSYAARPGVPASARLIEAITNAADLTVGSPADLSQHASASADWTAPLDRWCCWGDPVGPLVLFPARVALHHRTAGVVGAASSAPCCCWRPHRGRRQRASQALR